MIPAPLFALLPFLSGAAPAPSQATAPLDQLLAPDAGLECDAAKGTSSVTESYRSELAGTLGTERRRFGVYFDSVRTLPGNDSARFHARTRLGKEICDFVGTARIVSTQPVPGPRKRACGEVLNKVTLSLSGTLSRCPMGGSVQGTMTSFSSRLADGRTSHSFNGGLASETPFPATPHNRMYGNQFSGEWKGEAGQVKPVHWGDGRVPNSEGLDCGGRDFRPCRKYVKFGWEDYGIEEPCLFGSGDAECEAILAKVRWWEAPDPKPVPPSAAVHGSFTDPRDGKVYPTVTLGPQTWLARNLAFATDSSWCLGDSVSNCETYGRLYDQHRALTACPPGWHLPTDAQWRTLDVLTAQEHGDDQDLRAKSWEGQDPYGFGLLRSGNREPAGNFEEGGIAAFHWSATRFASDSAWCRVVTSGPFVLQRISDRRSVAMSVRCLKD